MAEGRGLKAEGRGLKAEGGGQTSEGREDSDLWSEEPFVISSERELGMG